MLEINSLYGIDHLYVVPPVSHDIVRRNQKYENVARHINNRTATIHLKMEFRVKRNLPNQTNGLACFVQTALSTIHILRC